MMFPSTHFLIDFINLKIKLVQSFEYVHRDMMYVRIFMGVHIHMCSELCKKKKLLMCPPPPGPAAQKVRGVAAFTAGGQPPAAGHQPA
jgi:hypothetical protein